MQRPFTGPRSSRSKKKCKIFVVSGCKNKGSKKA
jgi:hypothetical protein